VRFTRSLPLAGRRRRGRPETAETDRDLHPEERCKRGRDIRCDSSSLWIGDRRREILLLDRIGAFRAGRKTGKIWIDRVRRRSMHNTFIWFFFFCREGLCLKIYFLKINKFNDDPFTFKTHAQKNITLLSKKMLLQQHAASTRTNSTKPMRACLPGRPYLFRSSRMQRTHGSQLAPAGNPSPTHH
jgi:hypothetical protein